MDVEITCDTLIEIHQIQQLKYRYTRAVDTHDWALMGECLADDVKMSYNNGTYKVEGRDNALTWMASAMDDSIFSSHIAVHPEIELTSPITATGVWRLQDTCYWTRANPDVKEMEIKGGEKLEGAAYYSDTYVKINGVWRIQSTGYIRIYTAIWNPGFRANELICDPLRGLPPA